MTDLNLVKHILSRIPEKDFQNPKKTFIDFANGTGVFPLVVIYKLMNGLSEIIKELEPFGTVEIDTHQCIVSIVGNEIMQTEDVMEKLFRSIKNIPVRMVSYGGSHHNISILIDSSHKIQTLQSLNIDLFGLE